ncbi:MAG TPA: 23S rRNA (adenine(2503)-C(2))-methyltransferase RlmN [Polyangiaceae bacterium]
MNEGDENARRAAPALAARLPDEIAEWLGGIGEPRYRAVQLFRWLHRRGVFEPERMTDLGAALRRRLTEAGLAPPAEVVEVRRGRDGTRKLLLLLADGARIEAVVIPMTAASSGDAVDDEDDARSVPGRVTLCVSTQVGCAMGCVFCASGQAGLVRGLGAHEIVAQVLLARGYLDPGEELKNLVFMGMGEPLHHYDETARAIRLLTHADGLGMSPRRITVSTVGLVPGIRRLGRDFAGKVGLAVSLHAPDDVTRSGILPMNRRYPMRELLAELKAYPMPRRRRITIEYTLIAGVNDGVEQARRLAEFLRGLRVKVNLIPMNSIAASALRAPMDDVVERFREELAARGLSCFVRTRRGDDVAAACGQLALSGIGGRPPRGGGEACSARS